MEAKLFVGKTRSRIQCFIGDQCCTAWHANIVSNVFDHPLNGDVDVYISSNTIKHDDTKQVFDRVSKHFLFRQG